MTRTENHSRTAEVHATGARRHHTNLWLNTPLIIHGLTSVLLSVNVFTFLISAACNSTNNTKSGFEVSTLQPYASLSTSRKLFALLSTLKILRNGLPWTGLHFPEGAGAQFGGALDLVP